MRWSFPSGFQRHYIPHLSIIYVKASYTAQSMAFVKKEGRKEEGKKERKKESQNAHDKLILPQTNIIVGE